MQSMNRSGGRSLLKNKEFCEIMLRFKLLHLVLIISHTGAPLEFETDGFQISLKKNVTY